MPVHDDNPEEPVPFAWIRCRVVADAAGVQLACERCGMTRNLAAELTEPELRRETHDFVIKHKHCTPRTLQ